MAPPRRHHTALGYCLRRGLNDDDNGSTRKARGGEHRSGGAATTLLQLRTAWAIYGPRSSASDDRTTLGYGVGDSRRGLDDSGATREGVGDESGPKSSRRLSPSGEPRNLGTTTNSPQQHYELADYDEHLCPRHLAPAVVYAAGPTPTLTLDPTGISVGSRGGIEIRVSNATIVFEEEMDNLPAAARRRRRRPQADVRRLRAAYRRRSAGWRLVLACGTTAMRAARRLGGKDGPSVPLTNEADDNRRKADGMDARTASLLPRGIAPRPAGPVAQGHGAGVSRNPRNSSASTSRRAEKDSADQIQQNRRAQRDRGREVNMRRGEQWRAEKSGMRE
ncbi:hypothetical protein BJ912DRAFT_932985 [Pholiota molesta]|nr:hypothetical protein BJ912DRAFT_932985 [Pholiota molesta]